MKVSDVRKICSDFYATRKKDTGKLTCKYRMPDDMCSRQNHFVCELVSYKARPKNRYISFSRIRLWEECERHWAFRYFWHVDSPDGPPKWAAAGRAFALCRAKIDAGQDWEIPDDVEDEVDRIRLECVLKGYATLPTMAYTSEDRVSALIDADNNLDLLGYIDGLSENGTTVYEWKYAADPSNYNILTMQYQIGAYFRCLPDAKLATLAVAKKPSRLKPRKGESLEEFKDRLESNIMEDTGKWFTFKTFKREEFDIDAIIDQMINRWHESETARKIGTVHAFYPAYARCADFGGCEFKDFCKTHTGSGIGCKTKHCSHPDICSAISKVSF